MYSSLLLLAVSLLFLVLEFCLPGTIMAICSIAVYIYSLTVAWSEFSESGFVLYILASFLLSGLLVRLTLRCMKRFADKNTFYLSSNQEGFQGAEFDSSLLGKRGKAITDLRPSGHALIDNKRVQVISQTSYIEQGSSIEVLSGKGAYLVVQYIEQEDIE